MKCTVCGVEYADALPSCPNCKSPTPAAAYTPRPAPYTTQPTQYYDGYAQYTTEQPQYAQSVPTYERPQYPTAVELIRQMIRHRLFLVATILTTVYLGLSFITSSGALNVPSILQLIALWMLYTQAKKDTGPFTLAKRETE